MKSTRGTTLCVQQQRSWVKSVMHNNTWAINYNYYTLQQHAWASGSWDPPQAAQVPQSYIAIAPLRVLTPLGSVCAVILMWLNMKIALFFWGTTGFWQKSDWSFTFVRIVRCLNQAVFIQAILSTTLADLESMRTWKSNNRPMRCHFGRLDCNC